MPSKIHCPNCQSEDIIDYGHYFECSHCKSEFFKESFNSEINEEDILSEQELEGFVDTFDELKDKNKRKKFLDSLKDDYL